MIATLLLLEKAKLSYIIQANYIKLQGFFYDYLIEEPPDAPTVDLELPRVRVHHAGRLRRFCLGSRYICHEDFIAAVSRIYQFKKHKFRRGE